MSPELVMRGVMTAIVTPFHPDGTLDEDGLRRYVRHMLATDGVTGILACGYSGEISALSSEERQRVVRICADEIAGRITLIAGIDGGSTNQFVERALQAKEAGTAAIQINTPFENLLRRGFIRSEEAAVKFYGTLDREVGLPMSVFQYPSWSGLTYPPEVLRRIAEIDHVVAVKEAVDLDTYVADFHALNGKIALFADHNGYTLLPMLLLGAEGTMVGISNVGTHLWVELFACVQAGNLTRAVELTNTTLLPLMEAFSRDLGRTRSSFVARIKEALTMMGLLTSSFVREPETLPTDAERDQITAALANAGLLARAEA